jgi:hypothetical protein
MGNRNARRVSIKCDFLFLQRFDAPHHRNYSFILVLINVPQFVNFVESPETGLAKNRVSMFPRNPVGKKPGFDVPHPTTIYQQ